MAKQTQLIAYINRFGESSIQEFHQLMKEECSDIFGGIHILPFYFPIDGADAGYDAIDNSVVDYRLGIWNDIQNLAQDFELMADLIVNHISSKSPQFKDVIKLGNQSKYYNLFLRKESIFSPNQEQEIKKIVGPSPEPPFTTYKLDTGEEVEFWTTFSNQQIDINVHSVEGKQYIENTLQTFAEHGIKYVRLDAVGFCIKKAGTSCFMIPETYAFMEELTDMANQLGLTVLVEVHAHFLRQIESAKHVNYVYDFALPPLVLYSLATHQFSELKKWISMRPNNCFAVLDTHDGIGVNDVQADWEFPGLLDEAQSNFLTNFIHENTNGESKLASGTAAQNLDIYHINSSFYDAMGQSNFDYLWARAIQLFLPGVAQIYYGGFLAKHNDMKLLEQTGVGRDINRPYLSAEEIKQDLQKPIVQSLIELIQFRNSHPAFDGEFMMQETVNESILMLHWQNDRHFATLSVDLGNKRLDIDYSELNKKQKKSYGNSSNPR